MKKWLSKFYNGNVSIGTNVIKKHTRRENAIHKTFFHELWCCEIKNWNLIRNDADGEV